jgi:GNAT superfamily N-acetyltransferase
MRRAAVEDAGALAQIRRGAILTLTAPALSAEEAAAWADSAAPDRIVRVIRERDVWVAIDGEPVGWVEVDRDRVAALYVLPSHAGGGVGSALLALAEESIRRAGHAAVRLEASRSALGFYTRRGYAADGPPDAEGAWPMRKELGQPTG